MPNTSNWATFQVQAWYLKRLELYAREKPYMFAFDVSSRGANNTNHEYEVRLVSMADMRGRESQFVLDTHGFEIQHLPTALQSQDFDNGEIVRSTYYPEIESLIRTKFPSAYKIHIFSHLVYIPSLTVKDVGLADQVTSVGRDNIVVLAKQRSC